MIIKWPEIRYESRARVSCDSAIGATLTPYRLWVNEQFTHYYLHFNSLTNEYSMPHLKPVQCTPWILIRIVQISKSDHKICFTTPAKVFKPTKYGGIIIASTHETWTWKRRKNFNLPCKIPEDHKTKPHKMCFRFWVCFTCRKGVRDREIERGME